MVLTLPLAMPCNGRGHTPWAWLLELMATRRRWPERMSAAVGKISTGTNTASPGTSGADEAAVNGCHGWIITPST